MLNECLEDPFTTTLTRENYTEHDVANALKRFLRQLNTPLLGKRQNYHAWLRSTVDNTITNEQLIQYYRALLKDLKQYFPIHYSTLRTMIMHIHTVAMLADINSMTLSNLVSTFAPCLISQIESVSMNNRHGMNEDYQTSYDDINLKYHIENRKDDDQLGFNNGPSLIKLKRNPSFHCKQTFYLL